MNQPKYKVISEFHKFLKINDGKSAEKKLQQLQQGDMKPAEKKLIKALCEKYKEVLIQSNYSSVQKTKLVTDYSNFSKLSEFDAIEPSKGVSIVTCCMNRNDNLKKALKTWLKLAVDEIIIVDWSSNIPVKETLADIQDSRIKVIRVENETKWILTYGFNVGLRAASYEKIFKFDADIAVTVDFLNLNDFSAGEFIRGNWKAAIDTGDDSQKYVNGSFGAYKTDLLKIGFYNEFIRTYGYDDSDIYRRLTTLGLSQTFIDFESIVHLPQKEELRLANQNVQSDLFLGRFEATELLNLTNKYIASLYDFWFPSQLQSYNFNNVENNLSLTRTSEDCFIPEYILEDAKSYAVIQLLSWEFNDWIWKVKDNKTLAQQMLKFYQLKIDVLLTGQVFGFDNSVHVNFINNQNTSDIILHLSEQPTFINEGMPMILIQCGDEAVSHLRYKNIDCTIISLFKENYVQVSSLRAEILGVDVKETLYNASEKKHGSKLFATSVYDEKLPHRMAEYLECYEQNVKEFDILALYYEEADGSFINKANARLEKLQEYHDCAKVFYINIESRPSFRSIFDSIDSIFKGVTAFVSNADIAFDETINHIKSHQLDNKFLVLSRKEVIPKAHTDDGLIMNQFGLPNTFSADVWIYKSPLQHSFKAEFNIGSFHCDSFLNYHIANSGYELYNPCLTVNCFHIHDPVFNSSADKEITQKKAIQKKLEEEIEACGGVVPLRGAHWCRIEDILITERANQVLEWSDMIININVDPDGSNLIAALCTALMALKINSHITAGHSVWFTLPHATVNSDVANILFAFKAYVKNNRLNIGVTNEGKTELFENTPEVYKRVDVSILSLIDSYRKASIGEPGNIYNSELAYYIENGAFGINYKAAFLAKIEVNNTNDIDIYCLLKAIGIEDKATLYEFCQQDLSEYLIPFSTDLKCILKSEPDYHIFDKFNCASIEPQNEPRMTFVTSIFKGDEFFRGFLENTAAAVIESNGESILIDAASPEREQQLYHEFINDYPALKNKIHYVRLENDPGLYNCWKIAIESAKSEWVGNANLDDRRSPFQASTMLNELYVNPHFSGSAAAIRATTARNTGWHQLTDNHYWFSYGFEQLITFDKLHTKDESGLTKSQNIMHCMPIWKKSLHDKYGYFNEDKYGTSADWAFWLECTQQGEQFCLVPEVLSQYYINEQSHNRVNDPNGIKENKIIEDYLNVKQTQFQQQ